jgi:formylglycine-generating enzyme required for sulfatase activity
VINSICSSFAPPSGWGLNRHTHPAVIQAIFAVSSDARAAETIWELPTDREWREVAQLVSDYVDDGDFTLDGGRFAWGPYGTLRLWLTNPEN